MLKLVPDLRPLRYQDKLKKAKLLTLQTRRIQHKLTFMHKMKFNNIDMCFDDFFLESTHNKTRGNIFKLIIPKTRTKIRHNFFSISTIKHWNALKTSEIKIRNSRIFKKKVLNYF